MTDSTFDGLADLILALSLATLLLPLVLRHVWLRREAHMTQALQAKLGVRFTG